MNESYCDSDIIRCLDCGRLHYSSWLGRALGNSSGRCSACKERRRLRYEADQESIERELKEIRGGNEA